MARSDDRWNIGNPLAHGDDGHDLHSEERQVDGKPAKSAHHRSLSVPEDVDPSADPVDAAKYKGHDGVDHADDEEKEDDDCHLFKEVLVATLVKRELEPLLVRENLVAIETVTVVRISTFGRIRLEILFVLHSKLLLNLIMIKILFALATRCGKADQQALERDCSGCKHDIRVQLGHLYLDIVKRHIYRNINKLL